MIEVSCQVLPDLNRNTVTTMAIPHAQPGDVVDVRPFADAFADSKTTALFQTAHLKVIRMVMPKGKVLSEHTAPGEIIVQCLEGNITFTTMGEPKTLQAGDMLYLAAGETHALEAIEDSSFLLTVALQSGEAIA